MTRRQKKLHFIVWLALVPVLLALVVVALVQPEVVVTTQLPDTISTQEVFK